MAFFDKLNSLARSLSDTTSDAIATGKLNSKINSENAAAGEALKQIGEYYYRVYAEGGDVAPEVLEFCENAKAHYDAADDARAEIERIKAEQEKEKAAPPAQAEEPNGIACPSCGKINAPGTKFCSECGSRLEMPRESYCPECGAAVQPGVKFCSGCGHRMEG